MTAVQQRLLRITGGEPLYPLGLLFVLNFVDELDQVAFGVFGPNAEATFNTSETTITTIGTLSAVLVITLIVPAGFLSDRYNRVRLALGAAGAWATMSVLTGGAGFIGALWVLAIARIGSGLGRVMNEPVHASLRRESLPLSDCGLRPSAFGRRSSAFGLPPSVAGVP